MNRFRTAFCLIAIAAMGTFYFTGNYERVALADGAPQTLPFTQNWNNVNLITTNDDWSGVPGIIGYRGDDLSTTISVDLRTVLDDGSATPVDVIANGTNPNTSSSGGVGEFEITDPIVALQGSGTADIPHIVIHLNTTGETGIRFQCNLRDIDGAADDAEQPINIQYRVGGTGSYTNVDGGYFADVTTGPSEATLVTPVDVVLPADANNQSLVEIRVMTTNVFGSDEWVGIDDILVTAGAKPPVPSDAPLDFDGDGVTDFSVIRNTGGGVGGQVTWFNDLSSGGLSGAEWGISTDMFLPADYDGDGKDDLAVWRSGPAGTAAFYILQSGTGTVRIDVFGQVGDNPRVVGDYNGDGKDDVAVYRGGANSGDQSYWFFRTEPDGPISYNAWGSGGDFPAPGDYDGDGSNDFAIQRAGEGGQARFWIRTAAGAVDSRVFGLPNDIIAPGDYDGDGKTDIAVTRVSGGQRIWYILPSGGGNMLAYTFGLESDLGVPGDYDGDGTTDIGVWRQNPDPTQNYFYVLSSEDGSLLIRELGQQGDFPVGTVFLF